MKKGLSFLMILILFNTSDAQNNNLSVMDSHLLKFQVSKDTVQDVKPYINLISAIFNDDEPKDMDKFKLFLDETLALALKLEDAEGQAWLNYYMARFYISSENGYTKALPYLLQGIAIFEKLGHEKGISMSYMQMGLISYITQFYEDAIKNFEFSLQNYSNPTSRYLMAISHGELGDFVASKKQFYLAIEDFKKAKRDRNISECHMYLGQMYVKEGNLDSAFYFLSLAFENQKIKKRPLARPLALFSEYFVTKGAWDEAEKYALESIASAASETDKLSPLISSKVLSEVYNQKKDFGKAFFYLKMHNDLKNNAFQFGSNQKIAQMQTIFQFKKKIDEEERRHEEEMRQNTRTKNIFLVSSIFVLLVAGALFSRLQFMRKSKAALQEEKNISEKLLLNILPAEIALELKEKGAAEARNFDLASILFTDFKNFTEKSELLNATTLVKEINHCFQAFDAIVEKYEIEKIKTIGDAYMAAGGLPIPTHGSVKNTVLAALEMQNFIGRRTSDMDAAGEASFEMRVGIHTGPVVAGIVGVKKFQYDIWGDTVNTASRMESNGDVGKVNISQVTYQILKEDPDFSFESRGKIEVKGKGEMEMWFVKTKGDITL
jgi:adenylate cyclase